MAEVDILLPVRSPAPWLDAALAGVRDLTGPEWHLVVAIHGSGIDIRETLRASGMPVTIVEVDDRANLAGVLNAGLASCTSRYVARLDADDIPVPDRLAVQVAALDAEPSVAVVCSSKVIIDEQGRDLGMQLAPRDEHELRRRMRWKNVVWHPTVMFRRDVIVDLGGYDERAQHVEDYELWLRVLRRSRIQPIARPLLAYRLHSNQVTASKVIQPAAVERVGAARIDLARALGESTVAAAVRQRVWSARQGSRNC